MRATNCSFIACEVVNRLNDETFEDSLRFSEVENFATVLDFQPKSSNTVVFSRDDAGSSFPSFFALAVTTVTII